MKDNCLNEERLVPINLTGHSRKIKQVKNLISQVANTDVGVIVTGESGTGKEIVARLIHYHSKRKNKAFVAVNCGAIPHDLLESELFGHEKGAFTGAISSRIGRFELAQGGTIFLDEIGDMPLSMQVKLLRVIQEKTIEKVGSNVSIKIDVRIICATHRNLENEIKAGRFREDLYYRLSVFPIEMPSLRERIEDLEAIISDLIFRFEKNYGTSITFSQKALDTLKKYSWNGNVRELSNLIERLIVVFPNQTIDAENLPEKYSKELSLDAIDIKNNEIIKELSALSDAPINLKEMLTNIEVHFIKNAMEKQKGVISHAAELLGMRRTTLIEKMKKYEMVK